MMPRLRINYILPALMLAAAPQFASAQTSASLSGLFACEALTDSDAELACFRAETAKLRGAAVPATPIGIENSSRIEPPIDPQRTLQKAAPAPKAINDDPEKFIPIQKDETPKKRTLTIQSVETYGQNGYIRFNLANGEVWRQTERGNLRLGKASPDKLTIKKGALGSFRARVNDKAPSVRVRRVK